MTLSLNGIPLPKPQSYNRPTPSQGVSTTKMVGQSTATIAMSFMSSALSATVGRSQVRFGANPHLSKTFDLGDGRTVSAGEVLSKLAAQQKACDGKEGDPFAGSTKLPSKYLTALAETFAITEKRVLGQIMTHLVDKGFFQSDIFEETQDAKYRMHQLKLTDEGKTAAKSWLPEKVGSVPIAPKPTPTGTNAEVSAAPSSKVAQNTDPRILENQLQGLVTDMVAEAEEGFYPNLVPIPAQLEKMRIALGKKIINSLMITGEEGIGRSSLIKQLALDISNQEGGILNGQKIFKVALSKIQDPAQLAQLVDMATSSKDILLYFDEGHALLTPDGTQPSPIGVAMRDVVNHPDSRVILEVSPYIAKFLEGKFSEWSSKITVMNVDEPDIKTAQDMMTQVAASLTEKHQVHYPAELIATAARQAKKFLTNQVFPLKGIDLLDESGVVAKNAGRDTVTLEDINTVIAKKTGLPQGILNEGDKDKLLRLEDTLKLRVFSQDEAIKSVGNALKVRLTNLTDEENEGPIGVFMFLGPTGVGKTETAKAVCEWWTGSEENLMRFDMGEYMESHSVARFIGAPPGYVGHEEGGQLTEKVKSKPFGVILLDECEKAHPDIYKALLPLFDEGRLTDGKGRTINAKNYIIILTSNIAAREIQEAMKGKGAQKLEPSTESSLSQAITNGLNTLFSPEQLSRINEVIMYQPLDEAVQTKIVEKKMEKLLKGVGKGPYQLDITMDEDAIKFLRDKLFAPKSGWHNIQGGRKAKDVVKNHVAVPLTHFVLNDSPPKGSKVVGTYDIATDAIRFEVKTPETKAAEAKKEKAAKK